MLPNPDNYPDWQTFSKALVRALGDQGVDEVESTVRYIASTSPTGAATSLKLPDGWQMVWLSEADAKLYLADASLSPPKAADLFYIDTANIANAAILTAQLADGAVNFYKLFDGAVGTQKLADLTVTNAKVRVAAIGTANVIDANIVTAKIADATIVTQLVGDQQVVQSKIGLLAVNSAQIANLAVSSGKIANLAVGVANIQAGAVGNLQIGNEIYSYGWNGTSGWRIAKDGSIEGTNIIIRNTDGSVAFAAGSKINLLTQTTGTLPDFSYVGGLLSAARTTGFGGFASLSYLTPGNISSYIQGAAIGGALIAQAAIGTALIADGAIVQAKIGYAAIGYANIGDAEVGTLKIRNQAVTVPIVVDASDSVQGDGSFHEVLSANVNVEVDFVLYVSASVAQSFSGTNVGWELRIYVNGNLLTSRGGDSNNDAPSLSKGTFLKAGNYTISLQARGGSSQMFVYDRTMFILGAKR
jgi:hypothetical protein